MNHCKDCRHIYTRPVQELSDEVMAMQRGEAPDYARGAYWGCLHDEAVKIAVEQKRNPHFVACEAMRDHSAPCGPDGVLFEASNAVA